MKRERRLGESVTKPSLDEDPNWLAYKSQEVELKANHMGKWVAFYNGQLVMVEDSFEELQTRMSNDKQITEFMVKQIVEKERTIDLGIPR